MKTMTDEYLSGVKIIYESR